MYFFKKRQPVLKTRLIESCDHEVCSPVSDSRFFHKALLRQESPTVAAHLVK